MKVKFYLSLLSLLIGFWITTFAQVSYNKRATGSIGNVPKAADFSNNASLDNVDMTTGTLKIGIPLYEIKVNDITVPISLNYTALGLKVGQEAGAPGMGWELSAGGKIITNVQGRPDGGVEGRSGSSLNNRTSLNLANYDDKMLIGSIVDGKKDGMWDTYNYILPGGGGTYIKNGLTFPYDPLITITHPYLIKTTDGLSYHFEPGDEKKLTKRKYYNTNSSTPDYSSSWELESLNWTDYNLQYIVSSRFKDTVKFNYSSTLPNDPRLDDKLRINTSETLPFYRDVEARDLYDGGVKVNGKPQYFTVKDPIISQSKTEYTKSTRLTSIEFPNGHVAFEYGRDILGKDLLLSVTIYQKVNGVPVVLKTFDFVYDEEELQYGHYLVAVNEYNSKHVKQGSWSFTYHGKLPLAPNIENKAQDRWGFYNGQTSNKTLLELPDSVPALRVKPHYPFQMSSNPSSSVSHLEYRRNEALELYGFGDTTLIPGVSKIPFANRSFVFTEAIKGTIKSVKTPMGATFEYEFEPHRGTYQERLYILSPPTSVYATGGGIRVKSITKKMGHDTLYYGYNSGERSFRKKYVYGMGRYEAASWQDTLGYDQITIPGNVVTNTSTYYDADNQSTLINVYNIMLLSHPINNMNQHMGSYGIYSSVTEYLMKYDEGNDSYGKTTYYSNKRLYGNGPDDKWLYDGGYTLEDPQYPSSVNSLGVSKDAGVGVYAVKKFRYRGNNNYEPVERTEYKFAEYSAPKNNDTELLTFVAGLNGQLFGPYPNSGPSWILNDGPKPVYNGPQLHHLYNRPNVGTNMDFLTATHIYSEDRTPFYEGKYHYQFIDLADYSNCFRKIQEDNTVIADDGGPMQSNTKKFSYSNPKHLLATKISTFSSKGDSTFVRYKYAQDYPITVNGNLTVPGTMSNERIGLSEPIEEYLTYKTGVSELTEWIKSGVLNTFKIEDGVLLPDAVYQRKAGYETSYYDFYPYNGADSSLDPARYDKQVHYELYAKGQVHKYKELDGPSSVIMWGYANQYPIAKVSNTKNESSLNNPGGKLTSADVAYTSFEDNDSGNWVYSGGILTDSSSASGHRVYNLASGSISKRNGTFAGKYIISYWYRHGSTVTVSGGVVGPEVVKNSWGNWKMAEREITVSSSSTITVSGSGAIDELRFHPHESQMTTYQYQPLIGLTCVIDPKGNIQYYEYDDSQRLKNIKDQRGNIIKSYRYNFGILN